MPEGKNITEKCGKIVAAEWLDYLRNDIEHAESLNSFIVLKIRENAAEGGFQLEEIGTSEEELKTYLTAVTTD